MVVVPSIRFNTALLSLALFAVIAVGLALAYNLTLPARVATQARDAAQPAPEISQAAQTKTTKGLLRQIALHLSKMRRGASVGGFPGFEPPKDDKEYQRKVNERHFKAQDVNDWTKEINNFLHQLVKKNPGKSLERILQEQGLTPTQIDDFVGALQELQYSGSGMTGFGVSEETIRTLTALMKTLGVPTWTF